MCFVIVKEDNGEQNVYGVIKRTLPVLLVDHLIDLANTKSQKKFIVLFFSRWLEDPNDIFCYYIRQFVSKPLLISEYNWKTANEFYKLFHKKDLKKESISKLLSNGRSDVGTEVKNGKLQKRSPEDNLLNWDEEYILLHTDNLVKKAIKYAAHEKTTYLQSWLCKKK